MENADGRSDLKKTLLFHFPSLSELSPPKSLDRSFNSWKLSQETLFLSRLWTSLLLQTPWFSVFLRLLGAKVGANVCFDEDFGIQEPWLVEIGDGTQIGVARISPHSLVP